ncbi:hypothetical protein ACQPYH_28210 [Kribbella sp. CA-245084]|uniref:hypothetical protein n=1 Tax=Kribbella sp. CA-245084 TaxID=3239940 RepID=UPI003D8B46BE
MVAFQGWRTYMGGNRNTLTYAADRVGPRFQKFCVTTTSARTRHKVGLAVSDKTGTKGPDENEPVSSGPEASAIGVELHKLRGDDGVQELDLPPVKEPLLRGIRDEPPPPVFIAAATTC